MKEYNEILESYIIDEPANEGILLTLTGISLGLGVAACLIDGARIRHAARKEAKKFGKSKNLKSDSAASTYELLLKNKSEIISIKYPASSDKLLSIFKQISKIYTNFQDMIKVTFENANPKNANYAQYVKAFKDIDTSLTTYAENIIPKTITNINVDKSPLIKSTLEKSPPMQILEICKNIEWWVGGDFSDTKVDELMDDKPELFNLPADSKYINEARRIASRCQTSFKFITEVGNKFIDKCEFEVKGK